MMSAPDDMGNDLRAATHRKAGLLATIKAVAWSFFGIRASRAHAEDVGKLNPIAVIAVGIALAVVFILTLLTVVKLVVKT